MGVSSWLWQINLLLAGFNLIPAAPLDGGRILRAALWRTTGRARAAVLAARAGLAFGVALMGVGFFEFASGNAYGLWPVLLGWFLFMAARAEADAAQQLGGIDGLRVDAVMTAQPPVVPSAMTVAELRPGPCTGGTARGRRRGGADRLARGRRGTRSDQPGALAQQTTTRLGDIAERIETTPVGRPEEAMTTLLGRMYAAGGRPAVVLDPLNRLAGIVTLDDVDRPRSAKVCDPRPPVALVTDAAGLTEAVSAADRRERLVEFVGRCPEEQWSSSPFADDDPRSVAVIVDHVADAYEYLGSFVATLARGEPVEVSPEIVDELNARHTRSGGGADP